jgi:hypothetical protein
MLGVKLMILSASRSLSRSGVCGAGTVLPRRRVGVVRTLLILSLLRKLSDLNVRLGGVGVESRILVVAEEATLLEDGLGLGSSVPSTTLMVVLGGQ